MMAVQISNGLALDAILEAVNQYGDAIKRLETIAERNEGRLATVERRISSKWRKSQQEQTTRKSSTSTSYQTKVADVSLAAHSTPQANTDALMCIDVGDDQVSQMDQDQAPSSSPGDPSTTATSSPDFCLESQIDKSFPLQTINPDEVADILTSSSSLSSSDHNQRTPATSKPPPKKRVYQPKNMARAFIKREMTQHYTRAELKGSNYHGGSRKNKKTGKVSTKIALTPTRINKILAKARMAYSDDFKKIDEIEVINEKCRKTT